MRKKEEKKIKGSLVQVFQDQGLEIILTPSLSMFGLGKTITLIIKVFWLVQLSFVVGFEFVLFCI